MDQIRWLDEVSVMPRENTAAKGRRYLAEGRLIVHRVTADRVSATCRGDGTVYELGFYELGLVPGSWWCSCPARTDRCAHLVALRLVTSIDLTDQP